MFVKQGKKQQISNQNEIIKNSQRTQIEMIQSFKQKKKLKFDDKYLNNIRSSPKLNFSFQKGQIQTNQACQIKKVPLTTKYISHAAKDEQKRIKIPQFFRKNQVNKPIIKSVGFIEIQQNKNSTKQKNQKISNFSKEFPRNQFFSNIKESNTKEMLEQNQQKKLQIKINYLMKKINETKGLIDKKREQKFDFLESQRNQRKKLFWIEDQNQNFLKNIVPLKQLITQMPRHKDLHALAHNPYSPKSSIYYVSQVLRAYRDQKSLVREHLLCSVQYLRMFHDIQLPSDKQIQHMKVYLDRTKGYEPKKTVVFDLDETLIHCNQNLNLPSDFKIKINFPTGQIIQVGINVRPFARQILAALSKNFQVIVFTASHSSYANVVLDHLDPQRKYIHHRLFRESCYCTSEGIYIKDLRIINRPLQKIVLIDNAAYSYAFQPLNGIPIIPYYEGKHDYQLQAVLKYLQSLTFQNDVREKNKKIFKLDQYHLFNDLNTLVHNLYHGSQS